MEIDRLLQMADECAHGICTALTQQGDGADEAVQVATMMLMLIKRSHPQRENVAPAMQLAEATLRAHLNEVDQ